MRQITCPTLALVLAVLLPAIGCADRNASTAPSEQPAALPSSSGEQGTVAEVSTEAPEPAPRVAEARVPDAESAEGLSAPAPELHSVDGLTLRRLVVARDVSGREPVEAGTSFPAEERPMVAFVDLANASDEDRSVHVTFEREDGEGVGHVSLDVPADVPRWRTWMRSRMVTSEGRWVAVVRTEDGALLGRARFMVGG